MEFSSNRLDFRLLKAADREIFISLYRDPKVMRKIGPVLSETEAGDLFESVIRTNQKKHFKQYVWGVFDKQTKLHCGLIMLKTISERKCEIGIMLDQKKNGKGYSLEALSRACRFALTNLEQSEVIGRFAKSHFVIKKQLIQLGFSFRSDSDCADRADCSVVEAYASEATLQIL